jgi:hypothetical protein
MDTTPYSVTKEPNSDFTRYSLILHVAKEPLTERWSLMIGDAIHCLRCVLDHLIYAIAIHESGQDPPPKGDALQFPICDSSNKFAGERERRLKTISSPVRAVIESLQPYNRPHPDLPPLLSLIRDFDNMDKHKLLTLAVSTIAQGNLGFKGPDVPPDRIVKFTAWEHLEDGAEIAAFSFDRPTPNMEYDRVELDAVLALSHKKGPGGHSRTDFSALLNRLIAEVHTVISQVIAAVNI